MPLTIEHFNRGDRPHVRLLAADGASAEISLHGAQVLSWQPAPGRERLYVSPKASHAPSAAIRGGIPVVFPQFGARGPLIKHGFARLLDWQFAGDGTTGAGLPSAVFELRDGPSTHAYWPAHFLARLHVALAPSTLDVELDIGNVGDDAFAFTAALHTYLRVDALQAAAVQGLEATPFLDSTRADTREPATGAAIRFDAETDRIYPDSPAALTLRDGSGAVRIHATGFRDTIVWNPGATLASTIADLGADEHRHFVCVEAGAVVAPITLAPGTRWRGSQRLQALPAGA